MYRKLLKILKLLKKERNNMKRILTYGTFDLLHFGHIEILRRAKALGDYLVVAVSTDEFNAIKNKKATICISFLSHGISTK